MGNAATDSQLGQPAALAMAGDVVVVADREGRVAFRPWPDGPTTVARAHQNAGPLTAIGPDAATSGGWEPAVTRWDAGRALPRWTAQPFDGRVTALAGQGDDVLVAGADRVSSGGGKDRVDLRPGVVVRIGRDGTVGAPELTGGGAVGGLVAGPAWFAVIDAGPPRRVVVHGTSGVHHVDAADGVTALGAADDALIVAGATVVEVLHVAGERRRALFERTTDATIIAVAGVGDGVVALTTDGVISWPGERFDPGPAVAIVSRGDTYLVLCADSTIEERRLDGTIVQRARLT